MNTLFNYTIFCIIAISSNISSQDIIVRLLHRSDFRVAISVLIGTLVGLVVKYLLDKKYIFRFQINNVTHDAWTFVLYTLTGVITTAIFWGFEFGFNYLFGIKYLRYLGGVIGLTIGYIIKYNLDKRYVFVTGAI